MPGARTVHSSAGVELVRRLAAEGDRVFRIEQARALASDVGLSEGYLRQALHHLARANWLVRLRKGLYAISTALPGSSPAHEFEIAMALVNPAAISHWSALHYHGLTDQPPRMVFVLTTTRAPVPRIRAKTGRRSLPGRAIAGTPYQFIQVKPERFFGTEPIWIGEARVQITDVERSLLDGLSRPQYCADFAEVLHAFSVRGADLDIDRIVQYALRLDTATVKRLGWVLEEQGIEPCLLDLLAGVPVKGYRKLDPTGPRKGPCNRRWMIQENLPGSTHG